MNLFQSIASRKKSDKIDNDHLPLVNDFVDVAAGGKTDTVCVENVGKGEIEVRRPSKAVVGEAALFNYSNKTGRFRFRAECRRISGNCATFAYPAEITVIEDLGEKRKSFRLVKLLNVQWRYAPDVVGNGAFTRGTLRNLSSTGACIDVNRELRKGTLIEIQFDQIKVGGKVLVTVAELMRPAVKDPKGIISTGVHFKGLNMTGQNAVAEFIQGFKRDDRDRHIAR